MFNLVLVLSLCYVIVECDQVKRSDGCENLQACLSPIDVVTVSNIGRLGDNGAYQEFCQTAPTFSACYQDENAGCDRQSVRDSIKSLVDVAEFLCTYEARSEIVAVSTSDCTSNELKALQLQLTLEGCELAFENAVQLAFIRAMMSGQEMTDFCQIVDEWTSCNIRKVSESCGSRIGTFYGRVWKLSTDLTFQGLGCGQTRNVRRNLESLALLLSKTAKLRR